MTTWFGLCRGKLSEVRRALVVSWYPADLPSSGERVRLYNLCRQLSRCYEVSLLSFSPSEGSARHPWTDLRVPADLSKPYRYGFLDKALATLSGRSVHEVVLASRERANYVESTIERLAPDVVLANQLPAAALLPRAVDGLVVLDTHNAEVERLGRKVTRAVLPARVLMQRQVRAAATLEARVARRADLVLAVSDRDAVAFEAAAASRVVVVPNGVDLDVHADADRRRSRRRKAGLRLLFVGSLSYSANRAAILDFCRDWAPLLGDAWCMDVVGSGDPGTRVRRAVAGDARVRLVGKVPDVQPEYHSHDALIVPIQEGGGTRLKVLEAMAARLPIISTAIGVDGLGLLDGVHYLRAEDGRQAAVQVARVLADPRLLDQISAAAAERLAGLEWDTIGNLLLTVLEDAVKGRG